MRGSKEGIREIQSPLGDGNYLFFAFLCFVVFIIREIQSPLGDGNAMVNIVSLISINIREIQSPLGDGNCDSDNS